MEIFLNGSSKETLHEKERPKTAISDCLEIKARQHFASSYHGGWFWTSPVHRPVALPVPVQAADPKSIYGGLSLGEGEVRSCAVGIVLAFTQS